MTPKKFSIWYLILFLIFVLVFFLSLRKIYDVDIGFHLRGGEWMLENKSFHTYDVFTYTVRNNEYIAMYWLYQIILFIIFKIGSDKLISIWNSILILIFFFLMYLRLHKSSIPLWLICTLMLLSIFPLEIRFGVRPEIFTYIFLVLMLIILDLYYHHKKNYLFLILIIQLFWVNLHGLFILSWVVLGCYLISMFISERKRFNELLKWSILAVIVSFINPYHIKGVLFPFYLFTRLQNSSVFKDAITEFASPFSNRGFLLTSHAALYLYFLFLGLTPIFLILTRHHRKLHEYLLFIAFGYLSWTAVRNIPLFIIIALPMIGVSVRDLLSGLRKKVYNKSIEIGLAIVFIIFCLLFSLYVVNNGYYAKKGGGNFGIGFDTDVQPIKAAEFLKKIKFTGRILNDLNRGSWLIWAVQKPVYIDGRLEVIKEALFQEFHKSHQPGGIIKLIEKYNPSIIVFDYSYPEAIFWDMDLENLSEWKIIYWDETTVIYGRNGYVELTEPFSFQSAITRLGIDTNLNDQEKWKILSKPSKNHFQLFLESLYKRHSYPVVLARMAFYASVKLEFQVAELLYLNILKTSDYHRTEVYFRLGLIYHFMHNVDKAEYCYQRVLQEIPDHKKAKKMLVRLKQNLPPVE